MVKSKKKFYFLIKEFCSFRYIIYSPKDNQACMDQDWISSDNGICPIEYRLVKLRTHDDHIPTKWTSHMTSSTDELFVVATTLRLETIDGLKNYWVHPDIHYIAFETCLHGILQ